VWSSSDIVGDVVSVHSNNARKPDIRGEIVSLPAPHITCRRRDERAGEIVVYFSRTSF
jgi:hypothetical protein